MKNKSTKSGIVLPNTKLMIPKVNKMYYIPDDTGNGHNLYLQDGFTSIPNITSGPYDRRSIHYDLSANQAFRSLPHADFGVGTGAFTFVGWFYDDNHDYYYNGQMCATDYVNSTNIAIQMAGFGGDNMVAYCTGGYQYGGTEPTNGTWHLMFFRRGLVAGQFDWGWCTAYSTWSYVAQGTWANAANGGTNCIFSLGLTDYQNAPWKGKIGACGWSKQALTNAELGDIYNAQGSPAASSTGWAKLLAWWQCDRIIGASDA